MTRKQATAGAELDTDDIGRTVTYAPEYGPQECGRIKSFDNERRIAFVVYRSATPNWWDFTGQGTNYDDILELRNAEATDADR